MKLGTVAAGLALAVLVSPLQAKELKFAFQGN